jgi:hypothetical protein
MRTTTLLFTAFVGLAGCVDVDGVDDSQADVDVGYDFATGWAYALKITGENGPGVLDLGTTTGRTCFLSGIAGADGGGGPWQAAVVTNGASYELHLSTTAPAKVWARCVSGSGTPEVTLPANAPPSGVILAPKQTGRRCFLTSLSDSVAGDFTHAADEISVVTDSFGDSTNWRLVRAASGSIARARCVDGTADVFGVGATAPAHGSITVPIENVAGSTCGLQTVKGKLTGDVDDGVWISRDDDGTFEANATNGKYLAAGCIR